MKRFYLISSILAFTGFLLVRSTFPERCFDCHKPLKGHKVTVGKNDDHHICDDCWSKRIHSAFATTQAIRKATTPPGPSAEALWVMAGTLVVIYVVISNWK